MESAQLTGQTQNCVSDDTLDISRGAPASAPAAAAICSSTAMPWPRRRQTDKMHDSLLSASDKRILYYRRPSTERTHGRTDGRTHARTDAGRRAEIAKIRFPRATRGFFTISVRRKNSLLSASDKRILDYRRPTRGFFTIGVRQEDSLLSASDKRILYYLSLIHI